MRRDNHIAPGWLGLGGFAGQNFDDVTMLQFISERLHNSIDLKTAGVRCDAGVDTLRLIQRAGAARQAINIAFW